MVSPIYVLAIALAAAFLLPLAEKAGRRAAQALILIVLSVMTLLPATYLVQWLSEAGIAGLPGSLPIIIDTAGFAAPLSIALRVGYVEAVLLVLVNLTALVGGIYRLGRDKLAWRGKDLVLYLMLFIGVNGLIMTRDLFNIFVFLEITSISTYALIASNGRKTAFEAGFKYIIAGSIASALYLIGVIFLYRFSGTLSLDEMLATESLSGSGPLLALFLLSIALLVELKPFPANGWALDAYQAADPAVGAMISAAAATGIFAAFARIMPLFPDNLRTLAAGSALVTFIFSSLMGLRQNDVKRMLGLSSTAQIALLVFAVSYMQGVLPAKQLQIIVLLLVGTHLISKAGLFWLAGITEQVSIRSRVALLTTTVILLAALIGLPPFPTFWAKWYMVLALAESGGYLIAAVILIGTLLEAGYLFKWFLLLSKRTEDPGDIHFEEIPEDLYPIGQQTGSITSKRALLDMTALEHQEEIPDKQTKNNEAVFNAPAIAFNSSHTAPLVMAVLLVAVGLIASVLQLSNPLLLLPLVALVIGGLFDLFRIPFRVQLTLAIASVGVYSYAVIPVLGGIAQIFAWIFLAGAAVQMVALYQRSGNQKGLIALTTGLIFSLGNLLVTSGRLELFFSWELMSFLAYLLIIRGKRSSAAGYRYLMFSLGGAYSILMGLILLPDFSQVFGTTPAAVSASGVGVATILLAAGFLIKIGAAGFHIWLPGAYAEADDDISPFLSSILSKAGLFMLFGIAALLVLPVYGLELTTVLGWIGVLTALGGAFFALFQEDIKYTLAYSSMGQMGYMLLAFALMSQLGWVGSLYLAVTHLLFKGMIFIAIAGIIYRTKTRLMYQMGGLISRMPLSFFTVLIAIIAISGVPPLTGFGAKWMLYTALIEEGWYLQAAAAMFASAIAFLYLFRLIHTIFLGQLKDEHRSIREAPVWYLIPQVIGILGIMIFSMFPNLIIEPLQHAVAGYVPGDITWQGYTVISTLGYWNGNAVMYVTMGVFIVPLAWLLLVQRKYTRKVRQFNIVYAAERPYRPETTHYAFNFFAPYREALGGFLAPWATRFWNGLRSAAGLTGSMARRLYTGNGQTYALHILIYTAIMLLALQGGVRIP
ncbi:MAG: proton-conducting transporter membrane subunit [Spirochaetota bacterium]